MRNGRKRQARDGQDAGLPGVAVGIQAGQPQHPCAEYQHKGVGHQRWDRVDKDCVDCADMIHEAVLLPGLQYAQHHAYSQ